MQFWQMEFLRINKRLEFENMRRQRSMPVYFNWQKSLVDRWLCGGTGDWQFSSDHL